MKNVCLESGSVCLGFIFFALTRREIVIDTLRCFFLHTIESKQTQIRIARQIFIIFFSFENARNSVDLVK